MCHLSRFFGAVITIICHCHYCLALFMSHRLTLSLFLRHFRQWHSPIAMLDVQLLGRLWEGQTRQQMQHGLDHLQSSQATVENDYFLPINDSTAIRGRMVHPLSVPNREGRQSGVTRQTAREAPELTSIVPMPGKGYGRFKIGYDKLGYCKLHYYWFSAAVFHHLSWSSVMLWLW